MPKVQLERSWVYQGVLYSPGENGEAEVPKEAQDAIKERGGKVKAQAGRPRQTEASEE